MRSKSKRPIHPASLANLRPAKRGEARFGGRNHTLAAKEKISKARRFKTEARKAAAEHARDDKVRRRLFQDAEDKVYRDALEYLLAHQIEPAEALREIVGDRKHPDRMRAVGEWLDRTHGKPTQTLSCWRRYYELNPCRDRRMIGRKEFITALRSDDRPRAPAIRSQRPAIRAAV